jgi:hypothetical protein
VGLHHRQSSPPFSLIHIMHDNRSLITFISFPFLTLESLLPKAHALLLRHAYLDAVVSVDSAALVPIFVEQVASVLAMRKLNVDSMLRRQGHVSPECLLLSIWLGTPLYLWIYCL